MSYLKWSCARRLLSAGSIVLSLSATAAFCQAGAPNPAPQNQPVSSAPKPSDLLHPALSQVGQATASLNISRWKAPGEVRSATQQNVDSIQRDLNNTLPGLLATGDAAPGTVSAVFPIYRNIDALYDVLLRVSQTAQLAAPTNEASGVTDALGKLESARASLGNAILDASKNNEAEVVKLRAAIQQAAAAQAAPPPKTTVINDGPAAPASTTPKRKKKPAAPAATTATPPASTTPPQH